MSTEGVDRVACFVFCSASPRVGGGFATRTPRRERSGGCRYVAGCGAGLLGSASPRPPAAPGPGLLGCAAQRLAPPTAPAPAAPCRRAAVHHGSCAAPPAGKRFMSILSQPLTACGRVLRFSRQALALNVSI
ncbi:hypothetical protein GCM10027091_29260 [Streptomyces daliensis]